MFRIQCDSQSGFLCCPAARSVLLVSLVSLTVLSGCRESAQKDNAATGGGNTVDVGADLTREQLLTAIRLKNLAIGHLENKEWVEAEATLKQLSELLPTDRLALRNRAIGLSLSILDPDPHYNRSKDPDGYSVGLAAARGAVEQLVQVFPDEQSLADLLAGKLFVINDSPEKSEIQEGVARLKSAAVSSGDRADYWFAVAVAMDGHRAFGDGTELLEVLRRCSELQPDNLFVLQRRLEKLAMALNSNVPEVRKLGAELPELMKAAIPMISPLNDVVLKQHRINLVDTINSAIGKYNGTNAAILFPSAMAVKGLILPETATQIDRRRIDRNLLEYLLLEFDETFMARVEAAGLKPAPAELVVKGFQKTSLLSELKAITVVDSLDMNLDGFDDLIVLSEGRIRVYSRGASSSGDWQLLMETPADAGLLESFLLVDVDRDFDRALSDLKTPALLQDRDGDRKTVTDPAQKNRWYDTDPDLVAWSGRAVTVYRNQAAADGTRLFEIQAKLDAPADVHQIVAADLEADGDLDLIAATSSGMALWKNLDGTQFELITEGLSLPDYPVAGLAIGDWNRDVAMDIVGVSAAGKAGTLQNMLHGRFRWLTDTDGLSDIPSASVIRIGDFDANLSWDAVTGGPSGVHLQMTQTAVTGGMSVLKAQKLSDRPVSALQLSDFDNDGVTDILAAGESGVILLRGKPGGTFEDVSSLLPDDVKNSSVARLSVMDYDDDGDEDPLLVSADGTLHVLLNDGGNTNHWLDVVARAVAQDEQFKSQRVNMHAIGGVMEMRAGTAFQAHIIDRPRLRLGLGKSTGADVIRIIWTDGVPQDIVTPELLRSRIGILAPQILKGSCPYIYTWNGEKFEFFSDCLWAAPIGLVQANGDLAPTREWENLLIPGSQLAPRNGRYVLQFTEELWEAAYFDEVRLAAIDHPADVSVFTNEKVGSPEMAAHRIHTVRDRRLPKSVVDSRGTDLLPGLMSQDGNYIQAFEGRKIQGLTDPWSMEFDPGLDEKPTSLRLVLIGWVFPTDTSLNVAIQQNAQLAPPAPPSIEVKDSSGQWTMVKPFIGFPSGKTKAMVVDLSDAFLTNDFRFRLSSSMELYWDAAFFIVDEADAQTSVHDCDLKAADLHFRGFSRRVYADNALFRNGHAPEGYDYDSVTTAPRWPAMMGRFTRYGHATELLQAQDDRMVVMGPGDELTVEFEVPREAIPEGWVRDFVLYNVGWDKDADLNTVYGQSSEPFPSRSMTRYPFSEGEMEVPSPEHLQYLDEWQTRFYQPGNFWSVIRDAADIQRESN